MPKLTSNTVAVAGKNSAQTITVVSMKKEGYHDGSFFTRIEDTKENVFYLKTEKPPQVTKDSGIKIKPTPNDEHFNDKPVYELLNR